jgi:hypothetical protein
MQVGTLRNGCEIAETAKRRALPYQILDFFEVVPFQTRKVHFRTSRPTTRARSGFRTRRGLFGSSTSGLSKCSLAAGTSTSESRVCDLIFGGNVSDWHIGPGILNKFFASDLL